MTHLDAPNGVSMRQLSSWLRKARQPAPLNQAGPMAAQSSPSTGVAHMDVAHWALSGAHVHSRIMRVIIQTRY